METSLLDLSARDQAARIADGSLSAETLMEAVLDRVASVNGQLNAIVSQRDADAVLAEARAVDKTGPTGVLGGVPTAIKDLADARGMPTSQGSLVFAGQMPVQDHPNVARLRAAGAIFIGKTNTPEFGLGGHTYNPVHGATGNPYDPRLSCGGSSGGAAVALSAQMLSVADGSDMMGSLRTPAGWCNVYGMRPTHGLVTGPRDGDLYLHKLSTHGPMARNPGDLAMLLDVMSESTAYAGLMPKINGRRIAWLGNWGNAWPMEDGILSLCETALGVMTDIGADVQHLSPPCARETLWEAWICLRSFTLAAEMQDLVSDPALKAKIKPEAVCEIERGLSLSAMDIHAASVMRSDWYRTAMATFETVDVLALPTAQVWPFDLEETWPKVIAGQSMDTYHRWMEVTIPASLLGLPAIAVPAGFGEHGLPMGLQLIGRPGSDRMLLEIADAYHNATFWPQTRPPSFS
jgi:amidase